MALKLLLADESLTIQKVIKLALSNDGYEIQTVSDGNQFLEQLTLFRPDAALVDIGISGRSVFEIKQIAQDDPDLADIPFILMSSAFEKIDEAKVALLNFEGRLTKPFDPSHLRQVIKEVLGKRKPSAPPKLPPMEKEEFEIDNFPPPIFSSPPPLPSRESDSDIRLLTESTVRLGDLGGLDDWNIQPIQEMETEMPAIPPPPSASEKQNTAAAPAKIDQASVDELQAQMKNFIEEELKKQLKLQLNDLARGTLADVAERVIREEIRKLLENAP